MERIIKKYREECELYSKLASIMWRIGQIILTFIFIIDYMHTGEFGMNFFITLITIVVLYFICSCLELISFAKKIKIKYSVKDILKKNFWKNIYQECDKFQKKWITNFCKKNKINTIEKLKIIKEELDKQIIIVRYIDPIIIGTLLIPIWELILQKISEEIGIGITVLIGICLIFIISIIIGWIKKEYREQKKVMNLFDRYTGNERLKELILYRILKS